LLKVCKCVDLKFGLTTLVIKLKIIVKNFRYEHSFFQGKDEHIKEQKDSHYDNLYQHYSF